MPTSFSRWVSPVACFAPSGSSSLEGRPDARAPVAAPLSQKEAVQVKRAQVERAQVERAQVQTSYTVGERTFVLDRAKAEVALAAKRVVGGRRTMTFNLLPLRYSWAYELYRTMKANHW